jgi:hypothetical protein
MYIYKMKGKYIQCVKRENHALYLQFPAVGQIYRAKQDFTSEVSCIFAPLPVGVSVRTVSYR